MTKETTEVAARAFAAAMPGWSVSVFAAGDVWLRPADQNADAIHVTGITKLSVQLCIAGVLVESLGEDWTLGEIKRAGSGPLAWACDLLYLGVRQPEPGSRGGVYRHGEDPLMATLYAATDAAERAIEAKRGSR